MPLMGVDVGTSSCKAVVFDSRGHVLASASREYAATFPAPARVEMDPKVLWEAVAGAIGAAARTVSDPIAALAISSHGETFVPVDARGEAVGPAILNVDSRAAAEAAECEREFGRERIFRTTGQIVHPSYPLAKFRWLQRHQPDAMAAAARFAGVTDYVLLRLGLPPYTDFSLASRYLAFDVTSRSWSKELLGFASLSADRLPIPVPAGTQAGTLGRTQAAELGLPAGTPVVVGGHDQACGAVGMGAIEPGQVSDSMGTYECLVHVDDHPRLDEVALAANLNSYCHVVPDQYITIAYFPAGIMVKWCLDLFAEAEHGPEVYAQLEAQVPAGPTGLLVLPHLIGSSTPHFDARATGAVVGLTPGVDRATLYKGVLEGLACELGVVAEALAGAVGGFDSLRATGGGARSRLGVRLRADITGLRFEILENAEAVCLGAALLGGLAVGAYGSLTEAVAQTVRVIETIEPHADSGRSYARQVRQYRALYELLARIREA